MGMIAAVAALSPVAFHGAAVAPRAGAISMMDKAGLEAQAKALNPIIGYFDPLNLAEGEFWGDSNEATIGFLREAEIKHGRVAMAAFVGYIVHANDIRFPWSQGYTVESGLAPQALW